MYETIYSKSITRMYDTGIYRQLQSLVFSSNNNEKVIDFSSNDYLNLSRNKNVINYVKKNLCATGSTGSRLISGNYDLIQELETQIAHDKNSKSAMIFVSGFQANFSVLSALLHKDVLPNKPIVFFDRSNHSSLYQAVMASEVNLVRYNNNDVDQLENLLKQYNEFDVPKFLVTEVIFGMDGTKIDVCRFVELAKKHNIFLYLDEAHAVGVIGESGYGINCEMLNEISYVVMGSFSKALACSGGYIVTSNTIKNYLVNKATGFIYSTAPPPMNILTAKYVWNTLKQYDKKRQKITQLANYLRHKIKQMGLNIYGDQDTQIISIIVGNEDKTVDIKNKLYEQKFLLKWVVI